MSVPERDLAVSDPEQRALVVPDAAPATQPVMSSAPSRRVGLRRPLNWLRALRRSPRTLTEIPSAVDAHSPLAAAPVRAELAGEFAVSDPVLVLLENTRSPLWLEDAELDSPLLDQWRAEGVTVVAPLLSNGRLAGVLALGGRKGDLPYTAADRKLLATIADESAPALQVARLVEAQQRQAVAHERLEQEMRMAHEIQRALLPRTLPDLPGWSFESRYLPARAVGGDFFDFIELGGGRLGILIGDVSGKGMPAALIMATTRSILRSLAKGGAQPGEVLRRANELLIEEMAPGYFVTCLYAVLEWEVGLLHFANAGHNPPFARSAQGQVQRIDAVGMPLGLLEGMEYDEQTALLEPGGCLLLYSDGVTEAHGPQRRLFGFGGLKQAMEELNPTLAPDACPTALAELLAVLTDFTGPFAAQEDDITLIALHRA